MCPTENYPHPQAHHDCCIRYVYICGQLNCIGAVKPRSAAEDWLAIGFDPWSAGKDPLQSGELPQRDVNDRMELRVILDR